MTLGYDIATEVKAVVIEIRRNGYLDREVRAVEQILSAKFNRPRFPSEFVIFKNPSSPKSKEYQACAFTYGNRAQINAPFDLYLADILYPPEGKRLEKILLIGHELGHIALNHISIVDKNGSTINITDRKQETEATHFARLIAEEHVGANGSNYFLDDQHFEKDDIISTIKAMDMIYDEGLLDKSNP